MLVLATIPRSLRFLTAAKSMNRCVIGFMARSFDAVAVVRPEDTKRKGIGRIHLCKQQPSNDSNNKALVDKVSCLFFFIFTSCMVLYINVALVHVVVDVFFFCYLRCLCYLLLTTNCC